MQRNKLIIFKINFLVDNYNILVELSSSLFL